MPVLHRREDGSGFYVRARLAGSWITWQVTGEGEQWLRKSGCRIQFVYSIRQVFGSLGRNATPREAMNGFLIPRKQALLCRIQEILLCTIEFRSVLPCSC